MRQRNSKQKGAALVESSLVLVMFIVSMVGIMDFAQFLYLHQAITNRVRGVTRTGGIQGWSAAQIQNRICYGTDDTPVNANGYFGLRPSNVNAQTLDATNTAKRLVVTVSGLRYKTLSPFLFGTATMLPIKITSPLETP